MQSIQREHDGFPHLGTRIAPRLEPDEIKQHDYALRLLFFIFKSSLTIHAHLELHAKKVLLPFHLGARL